MVTPGQHLRQLRQEIGLAEDLQGRDGPAGLLVDHPAANFHPVEADEGIFIAVHARGLTQFLRVAHHVLPA